MYLKSEFDVAAPPNSSFSTTSDAGTGTATAVVEEPRTKEVFTSTIHAPPADSASASQSIAVKRPLNSPDPEGQACPVVYGKTEAEMTKNMLCLDGVESLSEGPADTLPPAIPCLPKCKRESCQPTEPGEEDQEQGRLENSFCQARGCFWVWN